MPAALLLDSNPLRRAHARGPETASGIFFRPAATRARKIRRKSLHSRRVARSAATKCASGVRYYGRRYYEPKLGRWLGRDPIEEKGGLHLYGFVRNQPINRWDYIGLSDEIIRMGTYTVYGGGGGWGGNSGFSGANLDGGWGNDGSSYDGGAPDPDEAWRQLKNSWNRAMGCDPVIAALHGARAAMDSYLDHADEAPPGYRRAMGGNLSKLSQATRDLMNSANGLGITVFVNGETGAVTVAYRGTEGAFNDIGTDIGNGLGFVTGQYSGAIRFAQDIVREYGSSVAIDFSGHSLGGGLAAAAALATSRTATTYNAAGIGSGVIDEFKLNADNADNLITNYYNPLDPLTIGQVLTPIANASGRQVMVGATGLSTAGHSIGSIVANFDADFKKRGCLE